MDAPVGNRAGFTLIEILVVIAVIAMLAALVAPNVFQHVGTAKDATARSQIELLGAALDAYRLDNGRYPTTDQGLEALRVHPNIQPLPVELDGALPEEGRAPGSVGGCPTSTSAPARSTPGGMISFPLGPMGKPGGEGEDADVVSW